MIVAAPVACSKAKPFYFTAEIARGSVADVITATGTVSARTKVNVGSQASGTVAQVLADFGSQVRRGEVLAKLDGRVAAAQLARAQATRTVAQIERERAQAHADNAQRTLSRVTTLLRDHMMAPADVEAAQLAVAQAGAAVASAQASVAQAQAELALAQTNSALTQIVSPIDGVVIDRQVEEGQTVAAQFQVATLFTLAADMTQVQVQAAVDEADVGRVAVGQAATFAVDAFAGRTFTGVVQALRPAPLAPASGTPSAAGGVVTYAAIIAADNPEGHLMQGMTAQVRIVVQERNDVILVPAAALRFSPDTTQKDGQADAAKQAASGNSAGAHAYVVAATEPRGAPQRRALTLGLSDALMTEVISGLNPGEHVVVAQKREASAGRSVF